MTEVVVDVAASEGPLVALALSPRSKVPSRGGREFDLDPLTKRFKRCRRPFFSDMKLKKYLNRRILYPTPFAARKMVRPLLQCSSASLET